MNETTPSLSLQKALELIPLTDGMLCIADLPVLSLPCVVESRENGRSVIVTHFERSRDDYLSAIHKNQFVRLQFVVGFHYIDPTWIPRQPHAPTEVKAVFEISGTASLLNRSNTTTMKMLNSVTIAKQAIYAPESKFNVYDLPNEYVSNLFPKIVELEIEPENFKVSRLMVLAHLSKEHRHEVISKIRNGNNLCSRAMIRLFEVAYR